MFLNGLSKFALGLALASATTAAITAQAQTVEPLAAKFGAREGLRGASLAPDGAKIVVIVPRAGGGENAIVMDVASGGVTPILSSPKPSIHINRCLFVLNDRVVCSLSYTQGSVATTETRSRLYAISVDGKDVKMLTPEASTRAEYGANYGGDVVDFTVAGKSDSILMVRQFVPESTTGSFVASRGEGLGVEEVNIRTLDRHTVIQPLRTAAEFISDGQGHVRLARLDTESNTGYAKLSSTYMARAAAGGSWSPFSVVSTDSTGLASGFEPIAVDAVENVVYGTEGSERGFAILVKRSLDGSGTRTVVLARPDAGIDRVLRIGRSQRIIGASFVTERRVVEYFDPAYRALATSLSKALGQSQISFVDASADERKLLVLASSDVDPGTLYLFDRDTRHLAEVVPVRTELAGWHGASMQSVTYTAADGTRVPAYLTIPAGSNGKGLPAIVMPHGGPMARDEWGFDWMVQYFAARGYAVLQPQYRGSAGFGVDWFGQNGWKSWRTAISDVNDAGRFLLKDGIAAPGKLAIWGWSYGGYAALQSSVLDPDLFKAIVAVAPVTDLEAWRQESLKSYYFTTRDNLIGQGPHIAEGSPARHAAAVKAPVLLFHGDMDVNVRQDESRVMADRLKAAGKQVTYVPFKGLDHQLDDASARTQVLAESDAFIRKALGL